LREERADAHPDQVDVPTSQKGATVSTTNPEVPEGGTEVRDEATVRQFGYLPELRRTMGNFSAFALSFSGIGITVSIFATIAFVWGQGGPAGIWTWPIASVFYILLGLVFGELSTKIPLAGYSYQWGSKLANPTFGFFVGFFAYLAFQVGVTGTNLVFAPYFAQTIGWNATSGQLLGIAALAFLVQGLLLIWGLRIAARVNNVAVVTEIIGGFLTGLALLIWALSRHVHSFSYTFNTGTSAGGSHYITPFALSFLLAAFTYSAWEAPADLAEETRDVIGTTPRAMRRSLIATAFIGMVMLLGFTLAMPSLKQTLASSAPGSFIVQNAFGSTYARIFLVVVDVSIFATALAILAMASRVIFSMARDGMVPFSGTLLRVSHRSGGPSLAIGAVTIIAIIITIVAQRLAVVASVASIFYALVYLLITVAYFIRRDRFPSRPGAFTLGRSGKPIMVAVALFMLFIMGSLTLPAINHSVARASLAFVGITVVFYIYAVIQRRGKGGQGLLSPAQPEMPQSVEVPPAGDPDATPPSAKG
jgi:amino acid transporter